ncbi:MAG: hypothetical protein KBS52_07145 [Clostridiales bacterium]|nr:hypothetical protein [Candidatus Equinaster intestinalis]
MSGVYTIFSPLSSEEIGYILADCNNFAGEIQNDKFEMKPVNTFFTLHSRIFPVFKGTIGVLENETKIDIKFSPQRSAVIAFASFFALGILLGIIIGIVSADFLITAVILAFLGLSLLNLWFIYKICCRKTLKKLSALLRPKHRL